MLKKRLDSQTNMTKTNQPPIALHVKNGKYVKLLTKITISSSSVWELQILLNVNFIGKLYWKTIMQK